MNQSNRTTIITRDPIQNRHMVTGTIQYLPIDTVQDQIVTIDQAIRNHDRHHPTVPVIVPIQETVITKAVTDPPMTIAETQEITNPTNPMVDIITRLTLKNVTHDPQTDQVHHTDTIREVEVELQHETDTMMPQFVLIAKGPAIIDPNAHIRLIQLPRLTISSAQVAILVTIRTI